jgi:hypothetical protein
MPDLRDRFRALDGLQFPDITPDLESRDPRHLVDPGQGPLRRAGVAVLALAVGGAGIVFAVRAFESSRPPDHTVTQDSGSISPLIPTGGKVAIATYSYGEKPSSIYLMNEDGSDLTFLVEGRDPAFSPDGTQIAFRTGDPNRPGGLETRVNVINVDGTGMETYRPVKYGEASGGRWPSRVVTGRRPDRVRHARWHIRDAPGRHRRAGGDPLRGPIGLLRPRAVVVTRRDAARLRRTL